MCASNVRDDFAQVLLHGGDGRSAQPVIRAALDEDDVEVAAHQPVEATEKARRRLAAYAGVHRRKGQMG